MGKKKPNKGNKGGGGRLTLKDIEELMRHDSYKRINGAIRRIR